MNTRNQDPFIFLAVLDLESSTVEAILLVVLLCGQEGSDGMNWERPDITI